MSLNDELIKAMEYLRGIRPVVISDVPFRERYPSTGTTSFNFYPEEKKQLAAKMKHAANLYAKACKATTRGKPRPALLATLKEFELLLEERPWLRCLYDPDKALGTAPGIIRVVDKNHVDFDASTD
jgi:hypothetical protein